MEKAVNRKALGVIVKKYRLDKKLTVEKFSELSGVSESHIKNIESASTHASADALVRIANALETPLDVLLEDSLVGDPQKMARMKEYSLMMTECTASELKIVNGVVRALLSELRNSGRFA